DYGKEENATVIADATNITNQYRRYYHEAAKGYDKRALVLFDIPFDVCMKQNLMRSSDAIVDEKAMNDLRSRWEVPSDEIKNLYDEVIVLGMDWIESAKR
ncbi:MAG: hypothetical protein J5627_02205, partial [Bacilli bacterium]|nr:hypothetical protein [Bacilli bacterium]